MQQEIKICGKIYQKDQIALLREHENSFIRQDVADFLEEWFSEKETICVQSSGSTGAPKIMHIEKKRMIESAKMTCSFLGLKKDDSALLCMPLKYIGAKMVVVRSLVYHLDLYCVNPSEHPLKEISFSPDFLAMTPAQVHASLQNFQEAKLLQAIKHLIIGGGAINISLQKELENFPHHVWSTYGMTETLSHIALRRLNGEQRSDWYTPLSQVTIGLSEKQTLVIHAPLLCNHVLETNDIAEINDKGQFKILGRLDNVINSGGIKIQIESLEASLLSIMEKPFYITSVPDIHFGEVVTILIEGQNLQDKEVYNKKFHAILPRYHCPKHIFFVEKLPITETGKPNRAKLKELALQLL